jgi:hypothetical protein
MNQEAEHIEKEIGYLKLSWKQLDTEEANIR